MAAPTPSPPTRTPQALVALVGAATVAGLQVFLPRLFSVLLWYHLGFLAVSLAMLGFAVGGTLVRRRREQTGLAGGNLDPAVLGPLAAFSLVLALAAVVRLPLESTGLMDLLRADELAGALEGRGLRDAGLLLAMICLVALPFVLLGTLVCSALDVGSDRLGKVYGCSFLGGALGAGLTLLAMDRGGWRMGAGVLALLPALVGLARPSLRSLLGLAAALALLFAPRELLPFASTKHFPRVPPERVLAERSDATSHVVFYENDEHHGVGMDPLAYRGPVPRTIGAAIDAWAITFLVEREGPDDFPELLDYHPAGLAYVGAEPGFEALVIGAGGGWDVLGALHAGADAVTAVEINPFIMEAVRETWAERTGDLYGDPRVRPVLSEGRHFIETDDQLYDRIVLAGVDTFAATQAGAFALAENYLYTLEGLTAWLEHLRPGGTLFLTRWWFEPPRQTLRLVLTLRQALEDLGVEDPRRHIVVARGNNPLASNSLVLVRRDAPFTSLEIDRILASAGKRDAQPVYAWDRASQPDLAEALDCEDPAAFARGYTYRVDPTTDDRPFFFENGRLGTLFRSDGNWIHDRLGGQEVLALTLLGLLILSLPLLSGARNRAAGGPGRLAPFLLLGAGFLLVEVPLMQRLVLVLGHPVLSVAVVLVSLLVWSGLGSFLSPLLGLRFATGAPLAAAFLIVATLVGGHAVLEDLCSSLDTGWRAAVVAVWLAPVGLAMGTAFPLAVASVDRKRLSSAFLWNGVASVLAGPLAVMLAMGAGFRSTLLLGAVCYAMAAPALINARR